MDENLPRFKSTPPISLAESEKGVTASPPRLSVATETGESLVSVCEWIIGAFVWLNLFVLNLL